MQEPCSLLFHLLHRVFICPLRQIRSGFFDTRSVLLYPSSSPRTRDRRLASEIPLSILVAVDRLTFFGSVRIRDTKALRKNQWEESNPQHRNGRVRTLGGTAISSSLDRALPSLRHRDHRAWLGKQPEIGDISSKNTTSFPSSMAKTERAVQGSPHNACIQTSDFRLQTSETYI